MAETVRQLRPEERDDLMEFLERAYAAPPGTFGGGRRYPLAHADVECFHVIEKDRRIVSHVGLFPLVLVADGVRITAGGIGAVATHPDERGKGYMARLLEWVIARMTEQDMPISVLWGDRQRYGNFGWESAGEKTVLAFTSRSLAKYGARADRSLREVLPRQAAAVVERLTAGRPFRVETTAPLADILSRRGNRVWLGDGGYLSTRVADGKLYINEIASPSGREADLILAALEWCSLGEAWYGLCGRDAASLERLMPAAASWTIREEAKFRINDCFKCLKACETLLTRRAAETGAPSFAVSVGLRRGDQCDVAGVRCEGGVVRVVRERFDRHIELDARDGARLLFGGPSPERARIGPFGALLPIPIHVPALYTV